MIEAIEPLFVPGGGERLVGPELKPQEITRMASSVRWVMSESVNRFGWRRTRLVNPVRASLKRVPRLSRVMLVKSAAKFALERLVSKRAESKEY